MLTLLLALALVQEARAMDAPIPIFDGASLAGWDGDPRYWMAEDGAIVGRSSAGAPLERTTWLVWKGETGADFDFRCEVRIEGGNSGVQYRSRSLPEHEVHGPQADLDAAGEWTGGIYEQGARGVLVPRGTNLTIDAAGTWIAGSLGDRAKLLEAARSREWNELEIRCRGPRVELRWNGVLTARLDDASEASWNRAGVLALQLHSGPPMEVRFRDLSLARVAAAPASSAPPLAAPPGFEAVPLFDVPREMGSFVATTVDDRGRIYLSDERNRGLFRLSERSGAPPEVVALDVDLPAAQGLLVRRLPDGGLDLYVVVNAFGSERANGLWRARDAEDDGSFEVLELLMPLEGNGEHGAHAVVPGPAGDDLYVIAGNHTKLPAEIERSHPARLFAEDQLLPRIPDPGGHAVGVLSPGGWLVRTDLDGRSRELFAVGMRNAYDVAFDRRGRAFTYDSDMEWDMGAPWYRAPRVLQLEPGSDFGWRHGSGKAPDWAEETLGAVVETGPSSPTGVLHTRELRFHAPWDDVLLVADWAYGKVHAVSLASEGETVRGVVRPFLGGRPFPVADIAAHPDGSLIVVTGGRGTSSHVYRVRSTIEGAAASDPAASARDALQAGAARTDAAHANAADEAAAQRDPAHAHAEQKDAAPKDGVRSDLAPDGAGLASRDRVVRMRARVALEHLAPSILRERVAALADPLALGAGLVALARADAAHSLDVVLERASSLDLASLDEEARLAHLRAMELALARAAEAGRAPSEAARASALGRLEALYPTGSQRTDRGLAALLVALDSEHVVARSLPLLERAASQEDALHLAYVLRVAERGWTPAAIDAFLGYLHGGAGEFHGGSSLARYVAAIRDEATSRIGSGWEPPARSAETRAAVPRIAAGIFVKEWKLDDLRPREGELEPGARDLARGRDAYEAARCAECHRFGGAGGATGPDLTGVGARFGAEDLLRALLEPSRDLTDQYQDTEVWTTDGLVYLGRVVHEDEEVVTLMPPPPDESERIEIARDEIKARRPHPTSRMPAGLLDGLRREEALDLLAYLLAPPAEPAASGSGK